MAELNGAGDNMEVQESLDSTQQAPPPATDYNQKPKVFKRIWLGCLLFLVYFGLVGRYLAEKGGLPTCLVVSQN